jgi:2-dehydropantoate 2-reductase
MRVAVVGAGQMGSIYGAAAHDNGHEVWFVDASESTVNEINARGLRIDRRDGRSDLYQIPATADPAAIDGGCADLALFMVKGWATAQAAERVAPVVDGETVIVSLQNGLGNEEVLRGAFPDNHLLIGLSVHTVITLAVAHYSHTGVRDTYLGPSRGESLGPAMRAAAVFERLDAPVHVLPENGIRREQWGKFVLNCASLPTMALTRLPTAHAGDVAEVFEHMDQVTRETCEIARAEGIQLDAEERVSFQHELFGTAGGRASMLGDVLARRRTEIDTINGAAIRYAERHGLAAPLNRAMFALVKGLERSFELDEA